MADSGFSYDTLVASLSALGTSSGTLISLSVTGKDSGVMPLVDYGDFSQHVFFSDAIRKFNTSLTNIIAAYPIGISGTDVSSLSAANIYEVDEFRKKAKGFDLWLLDRLAITGSSSSNPNAEANVTVNATNQDGDLVPLIHIVRGATNSLTGSQTGVRDSISARAVNFEEENISVVERTAGTAEYLTINTDPFGLKKSTVRKAIVELPSTAETRITRGPNLKNMLPQILFMGDNDQILEKLLAALGDELDDIKTFIDQISNVKRISYDPYNRVPDKFLPILADEFGIKLFALASKSNFKQYLTKSTFPITHINKSLILN